MSPWPTADSPERFINRELSWLTFNERVLDEAFNTRHPLLERVRFLSISASNLDEFYMVRVAGLRGQVGAGVKDISQEGMTPAEQLRAIHSRAQRLMQRQQLCWTTLREQLADNGIDVLAREELSEADRRWLADYFEEQLFPMLTPIAIDPAHPFPFVPNLGFALVMRLVRAADEEPLNGLVLLPQQSERFVRLPGERPRFVRSEQIIRLNLNRLFPGMEVSEFGVFRVIRDSDVEVEEEAEDLVRVFESALKRRRRGSVIRLAVNADMSADMHDFILAELGASS